jgi:lipopolysaccharide/colanic/teichoic acid biosynthesis glycosyltransferase
LMTTRAGDPRITKLGRMMRRFKLDELPQLFNILCGEMSFVGPRPHVRRQLIEGLEQQRVLALRPGVTSPATLYFRSQEKMLHVIPHEEVERYHTEEIMPRKVHMELEYAKQAGLFSDLRVMMSTLANVFWLEPAKTPFNPTHGLLDSYLNED